MARGIPNRKPEAEFAARARELATVSPPSPAYPPAAEPERMPSVHEVAALIYAVRVMTKATVAPDRTAAEAYELAAQLVCFRETREAVLGRQEARRAAFADRAPG